MSALVEAGFDDEPFGFGELHPERMFGMIDPAKLDEYTLGEGMGDVFDSLEDVPFDEVTFGGKLHVLIHHEENGNRVTSIIRRERMTKGLGNVHIVSLSVFSMLKCTDGVLRGEAHTAREILGNGRLARIVENESSVAPLDDDGLDVVLQAQAKILAKHRV